MKAAALSVATAFASIVWGERGESKSSPPIDGSAPSQH
jgi:hypothetical protein